MSQACKEPMPAGQGELGWRTIALPAWTLATAIILLWWRPWPSISHKTYFGKWLLYASTLTHSCLMCACARFLLCLLALRYTCSHVNVTSVAHIKMRRWRRVNQCVCEDKIWFQGCMVLLVGGGCDWASYSTASTHRNTCTPCRPIIFWVVVFLHTADSRTHTRALLDLSFLWVWAVNGETATYQRQL